MSAPTLRHADPQRDGAACAAIYAPNVQASAISFEEEAPDAEQFVERIATTTRTHPWIVLVDAGRVVGYAYASRHRPRAAYRWAVDVGIYVDPRYRGRGAGRRLYEALFELLRGQNFRVACAGIAMPNDASIGLHEAVGFEPAGTYRDIGYKNGAWHDVSWWQLALTDGGGGAGPPPEPLAPEGRPGLCDEQQAVPAARHTRELPRSGRWISWHRAASSGPALGRTSATRARSRMTGTRSPAGSRRSATSGWRA